MDADPECRRACSKCRRIVKGGTARHNRRRAQEPTAHASLDGTVDECVPPEVVGVYNDLFQMHFLGVFRIECCNSIHNNILP